MTSEDGFLFTITGKGKIGIQTRVKGKYFGYGGIWEELLTL